MNRPEQQGNSGQQFYLFIILENAVGSRKSTQAFGAPSKFEKLLITNKVTTNFSNSLCTPISYMSFSHPTAFSRIIRCRWFLLVATFIITMVSASGLPRLGFNSNLGFFVEDKHYLLEFDKMSEIFPSYENIIFVVDIAQEDFNFSTRHPI